MDKDYKKLLEEADASRNEAEAARRLLNHVIERINDGFVALDSNWHFTYVNARAARMLQRDKPEDLIGKHIWTEYPEAVGQPFHLAYVKALETQEPVIIEEYYPPWDQWFENRIYPSPNGLTIYFTEITVRKKAEETLRQIATVFASIQDGIMITDLDAHILRVNQSYTKITGYTESEVLGQIPHQLQSDLHDEEFYHDLWARLHESGHWQGEVWNRYKNDEAYPEWFSLSTMNDEQGQAVGYVGVISDISERKQAEHSLNRMNRALMVLSGCNEVLVRAENETELLDKVCNIIAEVGCYPLVWIGFAEHDENKSVKPVAQSGTCTEYLDEISVSWADNEHGQGPTGIAIRTGKLAVIKVIERNKDYKIWRQSALKYGFGASIALPIGTAGNTYGALNIYAETAASFDEEEMRLLQELANDLGFGITSLRGVKERQQLQRQLQQAQKMEAIGLLTGGIAHDFNNILTSVIGYTVLALQLVDDKSDTTMDDYLRKVLRAGERARDLISQMLVFSRTTASNAKPTALEPLVKEVINLLQSTLPSSIQLHIESSTDLPNIMMDPVHLHQLVMNLCINARDALEGQGLIEVQIRQVSDIDTECASCHQRVNGSFVELAVRDTGSGIEPTEIVRIFDPFFSTKDVGKGTGMGLSMVHGIVHEHGGHILIETTRGKGSTFRLLFPAVIKEVHAVGVEDCEYAGPLSDANERHLLIVDDDESVAMFVTELLKSRGYQVTMMTNSIEALSLFKQNPQSFDLVITDQTMPGITGAELTEDMLRIRSDIPIILCTGYSEKINKESAKAFGIMRFLQKPFQPKVLLESVDELLSISEHKYESLGSE